MHEVAWAVRGILHLHEPGTHVVASAVLVHGHGKEQALEDAAVARLGHEVEVGPQGAVDQRDGGDARVASVAHGGETIHGSSHRPVGGQQRRRRLGAGPVAHAGCHGPVLGRVVQQLDLVHEAVLGPGVGEARVGDGVCQDEDLLG